MALPPYALPALTTDANGNLEEDGLNSLQFSYNYLNLTSVVHNTSRTMQAQYRWLADGTKAGVRNDETGTSGLEYLGSLVYKRDNSGLKLESVGFGGGRIEVSEGSAGPVYTPGYYIADHLGSTRVIWNGSSTVPRSDYTPFGSRWTSGAAATSRYHFAGYEDQPLLADKYADAGARFMGKVLPIFNGMDPLAEIRPGESQFMYAGNNPVRNVDPTGLYWYKYREKYEGENGDLRSSVGYEYREEEMTRQERNKGKYTDLGLIAFSDSHYLSLDGKQVDKNNASDVIGLMQTDFGQMGHGDLHANIGKATNYLSELQWNESLPASVDLSGKTFVVSTKTNFYLNVNDRELLNQYNDYYRTTGQLQFFNPMNKPRLSGEGYAVFEFLVLNTYSPPGFPPSRFNNASRLRYDRSNASYKMKHYRQAGIIR